MNMKKVQITVVHRVMTRDPSTREWDFFTVQRGIERQTQRHDGPEKKGDAGEPSANKDGLYFQRQVTWNCEWGWWFSPRVRLWRISEEEISCWQVRTGITGDKSEGECYYNVVLQIILYIILKKEDIKIHICFYFILPGLWPLSAT